ncbi:elongation factor P [Candidatus Microgenomates bacterium]|nr:elongation factor P [Candidatus Microgenomates bacterium]
MISVTELRAGTTFEDEGQIFQVISYEHIKMGRGTANIKVKVKNLRTGSTVQRSFISGARVKDISLERKKTQYLYSDSADYYFMDSQTFEQFSLSKEKIEDQARFLKEGMDVSILTFGEEPLSLDLPLKMEFTVTEAGSEFRGDSVSNVYKDAVLENELKVKVPLFIKEGEKVRIDTRTGDYVERAK